MKKLSSLCLAFLLFTSFTISTHVYATQEPRIPISLGEESPLPLRVLTRAGATLYQDEACSTATQSNIPVFQSYFVYTRPTGEMLEIGSGMYEVGTDDKGTVVGWMKGDDLFEWKQTMCLAFTPQEGRKPVLMFDYEEDLTATAVKDKTTRAAEVEAYYTAIENAVKGEALSDDFPIISVEPKMAVDITKQFYLLPILEHKSVQIDGRESRLLRIAAVNNKATASQQSSDIRENKEALSALTTSNAQSSQSLENIPLDVVWVVDTTRSMGPYIDRMRGVIQDVSEKAAADSGGAKLSFGIWAFRDSESIAGIEYNTKNYTPALQPVDEFLKTMEQVKETQIDSVDFAEDVFAGVDDAINKTAWNENSMKLIILIADAPSHNLGHKWNLSGKDEETLNALLEAKKIKLMVVHIMPPRTKKFNKIAKGQFTELASKVNDVPSYWAISANNIDRYTEVATLLSTTIVNASSVVKQRIAEMDTVSPAPQAEDTAPVAPSDKDLMEGVLTAAAVEWLGSEAEAEAPKDVEAWVSDKDLINPTRQALDVHILLNKRQLDSLSTVMKEILEAGRDNQISGEDFFTSLQAASAVAARDPDMLAHAPSLGESGMIPDFLYGLPYRSQLMDMNNDLWASWGPDEQDSFLNRLEAKIAAYTSIHDDPSLWIALNVQDDASEYVAPIMLELMP